MLCPGGCTTQSSSKSWIDDPHGRPISLSLTRRFSRMQDEEGVSTVLLQFARNGDTLAPLSPPWTVVEYSVSQLALNRAVIKLFTANFSELNLHLFDVAGTGVLKAMTPAAVTTPESPNAIAFDPTGHIPLHDGAAATGISTYGVGAMSASAAQSSAGGAGLGMAVIAP